MASSRMSLKRSLLLSIFLALAIFSAVTAAQRTQPTRSSSDGKTTSTSKSQEKATPSSTPKAQPSSSDDSKPTQTEASPSSSSSSSSSSKSSSSSSSSASLPGLSSSTTSATSKPPKLTGLPTLTRTSDTSIPTYPPPSPPPTQNAPFMNRSTLPDGTVFIAVGAILGAFGAAVLIWRGIVACLLHRSVEKAAMAQHAANDKASFPAPPAPFYKYTDRDSSPSLAMGPVSGRGQRRTHRGPTPSATPSQTNLFFSPTASGVGGMGGAGNRDSRFLPSGFYAATSASPVSGHGHGTSISLSNLRPASRGHTGPSPPDSPSLGPRGTPTPRNFSTSSFNLNRPPSERAPSAFLDDLLDDQPGAFPPGHGVHHRTFSQSTQGRR
ncbi:hypothetical protein VTK73DRAFT_4588 [Phialemonium thermophilum]|uniref:Uncharacterized protein n=1 Tax=Phialemonium thermophilum TaxID=223376 RepID=A0ABR3XZR4_9PEZI